MSLESLPLLEIALRLLAAFGAGILLGLERETHGRPAGLRTTVLTCVAAAMAMILSEHYALSMGALTNGVLRSDPGRLAAGVLSGIGFLGAGTIFRSGSLVRGVTTAAVLWFSTVLGLVFGSGEWLLGLAGLVLAGATLGLLPIIDNHVSHNAYTRVSITTSDLTTNASVLKSAITGLYLKIEIFDIAFNHDFENSRYTTTFDIKFEKSQLFDAAQEISAHLEPLPGVVSVTWDNRSN